MKVGTFFSGIGSPEQALKNLGIKHSISFACDIDKYAKKTYLKHFKPKNFYTDITKLNMDNLPYVDLLVFGFPCQAFSMAGKRLGFEDTRGTLFYDALRYLKKHRPRYFIAENVKGLISHNKKQTFKTIIECLAKSVNKQLFLNPFNNLGYNVYFKVLNTKNYGIPQNRERVFIIGIRDEKDNNFSFPKEIPLKLKLKDILQDNPHFKYNVSQKGYNLLKTTQKFNKFKVLDKTSKMVACITSRCNKISNDNNFIAVDEKYYLKEENIKKLKEYNKRNKEKGNGLKVGGQGADDLIWVADYRQDEGLRIRKNKLSPCLATRKHSETDISTMPPLIKIRSKRVDKPIRIGKVNKGGQGDRIYCSSGSAITISSCGGGLGSKTGLYKINNRIRRLTPIECERLQGFPDNFTEGVSDSQRYKQLGNTITVNVIQAILKNLL